MLSASHLTKKFGELVAVDNLSFSVNDRQIYGIAGPNGAGKSTVYNLITGHYPYQGKIFLNGRDITGLSPHRIAKLGIARTFQTPKTFPSLTVEKSIALGSRFGNRKGLEADYVDHVIDFLDLKNERLTRTGALNLLNKKKLMIGAALATRPKVLMLDEPMAGSNTREIRDLMEIILRVNREMGVTIIIIEHFMKVLTELTDRLLIIENGAEICCGDPEDVTRHPEVIEIYLGDAYAEDN